MSEVAELEKPTFDQVPELLAEVRRQNRIIISMLKGESIEERKDPLFSLDQLREYLPEKPARQTIYGWVNNRLIPFQKHGSRLYFKKSAIDNWLENGRQML